MEFATPNEQGTRAAIEAEGWRIEYARWDTAQATSPEAPVIIAFHGFARPLEDMRAVHSAWPEAHTFVSVHLPHHGRSGPLPGTGPEDRALEPTTFNRIIDVLLEREGLAACPRILLGYSIGGRIALALAEAAPENWGRLVLLAPDGLKKSPFYALTVHTALGRWAWFWMDRHEQRVWNWSDALLKWGLISQHLHGFIYFHSSSHAMRMMVWNGWRGHRACWPRHKAIATALEKVPQADFVFGEFDKIIPPRNGRRLRRMTQNTPHVQFHSVRSGHNMLKTETMEAIIRTILGS